MRQIFPWPGSGMRWGSRARLHAAGSAKVEVMVDIPGMSMLKLHGLLLSLLLVTPIS